MSEAPRRLKMAPPVLPLPLIPVPGREPRGRGGGGRAPRGGEGAPRPRAACQGRVVSRQALGRCAAGGREVGPSLSLSLVSGEGGRWVRWEGEGSASPSRGHRRAWCMACALTAP